MKSFVWIPAIVFVISGVVCALFQFGVLREPDHNEELNNQIPFYFTWNGHSYYKFTWGREEGIVHNPDCICSNSKDYQLELEQDSIIVYDKKRVVKVFCNGENKQLDSILVNDNL